MITEEQIQELGGIKLTEGKKYSSVLLSPSDKTYSLKSAGGNEYIYFDGEVFYHSDGKEVFVTPVDQDLELLKDLLSK